MEDDQRDGCLWWRLFAQGDSLLSLWACLRSWRAVILRRKRRFTQLTPSETLDVEFVEDDLPLHAVVACVDGGDAQIQRLRFEWVRRIVDEHPMACESLDRHQRVALYYALTQKWSDLDQLSWLVAKSERMLLHKDAEGRSLTTQAVLHACPQEIVMLMAVELSRRSLESMEVLMSGRHFESARRLCHRMIEEYLAGVPHFPHAFCRQLLRSSDVLKVIDGLQTVWHEFVDKWGYYGVPVVVEDLPTVRHVPLDSFLQFSIRAKGEPLTYQWYCDGAQLVGATQSTLFVSQCVQPLNEGTYFCEVTNWKGQARSSVVQLVVVDDKHGPDPSLRFLLSDQDHETLVATTDVVYRIAASRGGLVHASLGSSTIMHGCSLLLPPRCFSSFDADGVDVSDSVGMDVLVRQAPIGDKDRAATFSLGKHEKLVSIVVEVVPFTVPALTQPAILSIPHCWCTESDPLHEVVVLEHVVAEDSVPLSTGGATTPKRGGYREVARSRMLPSKQDSGFVSFEISRFGRFAVIARGIPSLNKESENPLEDVVLCVAHPSHLSTLREIKYKSAATVQCSVWLVLNRPDALFSLQKQIQKIRERGDTMSDTTMSSMKLQLREGQLLHVRVGLKETITHVWRGNGDEIQPNASRVLSSSSISEDGVVCLCSNLPLSPFELTAEAHDGHQDGVTIFRVLELNIVGLKPTRYQSSKLRTNSRSSSDRRPLLPEGLTLFEKNWKIFLPVVHDMPVQPPQPSLHQHRRNQLALAYQHTGPPGVPGSPHQAIVLFEDLHEMEREFTPYFYHLEIARFAETFWQRYDRTWWFDKTKSEILLGMYRLAHSGTEPFAVVASNAFAGAIRVVQCSIDAMGQHSEPYLLEPPKADIDPKLGTSATIVEDENEDENRTPGGLRRELTLSPSLDMSALSHASLERLRLVLCDVYGTLPHDTFLALFGVPNDLHAIRDLLERQRATIRAANREVALLIFAMDRLAHRIATRVILRSRFYHCVWIKFSMLRRLLPEIDCFPVEYHIVTITLHQLVRDLIEIAFACSSPGWFARLLRDDWFENELQEIMARTLRLLCSEAQALQGANDVADALAQFTVGEDDGAGLKRELSSLQSLREYILLVVGQLPAGSSSSFQQEIAHLLWQFAQPSVRETTTREDWADLVVGELASDVTAQALQRLREHDALATHIRSVVPNDQERFAGSKVPSSVEFRFGVHIVHVDTQHALRVTNTTLRCGVQGQVDFSREQKRLEFIPALPFDKHTRYQIKLRAQYVHTALTGALPPASTMIIEFSTAG